MQIAEGTFSLLDIISLAKVFVRLVIYLSFAMQCLFWLNHGFG